MRQSMDDDVAGGGELRVPLRVLRSDRTGVGGGGEVDRDLPPLVRPLAGGRLEAVLAESRIGELRRGVVTTLQVNVGKLCNQACHHCHVDAGPRRTEIMDGSTIDRLILLVERSPNVEIVDITGGAPELNPHFERLCRRLHALGKKILVRCNLTILHEPGMEHLPDLYRETEVDIIASLPCYLEENVDAQRGRGVFSRSIDALRLLNRLGFGMPESPRTLHLVYNPLGPSLPPAQAALEEAYKTELRRRFGIEFDRLFTITNMPISRFAEQLQREGQTEEYMDLLVNSFNAETLPNVMCRSLVSIGWDGKIYDCDFNQMLDYPSLAPRRRVGARAPTLWDIASLSELEQSGIRTADHCLGCMAGGGSSCTGALS